MRSTIAVKYFGCISFRVKPRLKHLSACTGSFYTRTSEAYSVNNCSAIKRSFNATYATDNIKLVIWDLQDIGS